MRWIVGSKDMLSDRPILAFPKVFITFCFYPLYGKCSFPHIALPTLGNCYLMGKKEKKIILYFLINGEVEVIFMFIIGHFYHGLFVHVLYL